MYMIELCYILHAGGVNERQGSSESIFFTMQKLLAEVALAITRNQDDAADNMQDVAYILLVKADSIGDIADPLPFLKACIRNVARNWMKREGRKFAVDPKNIEHFIADPCYDIEPKLLELMDWIKNNLSKYPPDRQEAFIKFHLDGYSLEMLEKEYGVSKDTLSKQFSRMRTKLQKQNPSLYLVMTIFMKILGVH